MWTCLSCRCFVDIKYMKHQWPVVNFNVFWRSWVVYTHHDLNKCFFKHHTNILKNSGWICVWVFFLCNFQLKFIECNLCIFRFFVLLILQESTLKSLLSALWNLSAHSIDNKVAICSVDGALGFLVSTLTYRCQTNSLAIIESGGGILRNVSSLVATREDYR